jgi:hypothetical protein
MSSVTSHTAHSERPERSRNAKAQARHRAKRKAYIDQVGYHTLLACSSSMTPGNSWSKPLRNSKSRSDIRQNRFLPYLRPSSKYGSSNKTMQDCRKKMKSFVDCSSQIPGRTRRVGQALPRIKTLVHVTETTT